MDQQTRRLNELEIVQNPAMGAFALWKFGLSYQARKDNHVILPFAFLVLPLVFHLPTLEVVIGTHKASGLALFAGKLGEKKENLLAIHERAKTLRHLTLESIIFGEQAKLLSINAQQATMRANALAEGTKAPVLPERIKWLGPSCEKLGYWFAGLNDLQIARTLNVEF